MAEKTTRDVAFFIKCFLSSSRLRDNSIENVARTEPDSQMDANIRENVQSVTGIRITKKGA
jgi:hypothetical protein